MNITDQRQRSAFTDKDATAAHDSYVLQDAIPTRRLDEAATTGVERGAGDGRVVKVHNAIVAGFDCTAGNRRICQDDRCGAAEGYDQAILVVDIGRVEGNGTAIMVDHLLRATEMEAEHLNAIASALAGLKDRTSQLRRYL